MERLVIANFVLDYLFPCLISLLYHVRYPSLRLTGSTLRETCSNCKIRFLELEFKDCVTFV